MADTTLNQINPQQPNLPEEDNIQDSASKYLAQALRASFVVLQIIMVTLVVIFLISGWRTVKADEEALKMRFGKIVGQGEKRSLAPGGHWVWPAPAEELIRVPVKNNISLSLDKFWFYESERDRLRRNAGEKVTPPDKLNPIIDGYCLTRSERGQISGVSESDYNIVHTKWQMIYQISSPELFFKNVFVDTAEIEAGKNYADVAAANVKPILEAMLSDSIIVTLVNYTIDDVLYNRIGRITDQIKQRLQKRLDEIECGIKVVSVQLEDPTPPLQVNDSFQALIKASQNREKSVSKAKAYEEKTLNEAEGQSAEKIAKARAYSKEVVESAKADKQYFEQLWPEYKKRPQLVIQSIYRDAIKEVLANISAKMFIQPTKGPKGREIRVLIPPDPAAKAEKKDDESQDDTQS